MAAEVVWCCARCSSLVLLSPYWFEGKAKLRCTLASTLSVIERGGDSHRGNRSADNGPIAKNKSSHKSLQIQHDGRITYSGSALPRLPALPEALQQGLGPRRPDLQSTGAG